MFSKNSQGQGRCMEILMKCTIFAQEVLLKIFLWIQNFCSGDSLKTVLENSNVLVKSKKKIKTSRYVKNKEF